MSNIYFVGVDVGTSSARAALVSSKGEVLQQSVKPIETWNPEYEHYEQSSNDIWNAVCAAVTTVISDVPKEDVRAISFDATCSLVIIGENGEPLSVSTTGIPEQNIILWLDHRAHEEAAQINATKHKLLDYVGGTVSVEMEMPKLLWLKKHAYETTWKNMWRAFDLPDFLTWRSTGNDTRSLCSTACKWNYDAINMSWNAKFLEQIGLEDLCNNEFEIIGKEIKPPGEPVGNGLSEKAAAELNLLPGTIVGTSLIDAHAGALAMFGCKPEILCVCDVQGSLAVICGTSTCHMSLTSEPCWARGVWGPYKNAIIPDYFLNEGGQSAAGLLMDHILKTHPQYLSLITKYEKDTEIYIYLNDLLKNMCTDRKLNDMCYLTKEFHVWPDFHGNRSPIADPNLRGMISGLGMKTDDESLAILYLAVVQALAYGTRHIIDNLINHKRVEFTTLFFCGGLSKNPVYVQAHADICQLPLVIPNEQEMVLVGAAMLGACASKTYTSLEETSKKMGGKGTVLNPNEQTKEYHNQKYKVYLKMLEHQREYKNLMDKVD